MTKEQIIEIFDEDRSRYFPSHQGCWLKEALTIVSKYSPDKTYYEFYQDGICLMTVDKAIELGVSETDLKLLADLGFRYDSEWYDGIVWG